MAYSCLICGYQATDSTPNSETYTVACGCCGNYILTHGAGEQALKKLAPSERARLAWLVRETHDAGGRIGLDSKSIERHLAVAPTRIDPMEALDRILLRIAALTESAEKQVRIEPRDFPAVRSVGLAEVQYLFGLIKTLGYSEPHGQYNEVFRLTPEGWARVATLRATAAKPDQAFVAMWFHPSLDEAWEQGFMPGIRAAGYDSVRIDKVEHGDVIDDRMIAEIRRSGLLIADYTGNRHGVYFEAGFAMGLGIPVVSTCRRDHLDGLHFDVEHRNHVVWSTPAELKEKLQARIEALYPRRGAPLAS
jgi:hypothetical protein